MHNDKLNILKELVVEEEHTLEDLKRLVEKSKPFLKIENKTGKIIFTIECPLAVSDKIMIYLIGVYFAKELGLYNEEQITSKFISDNINIAQTSISGPLGEHVRKNVISSDEGSFTINYYEIENQLDYLIKKLITEKGLTQKQIKQKRPVKSKAKKVRYKKAPKKHLIDAERTIIEEQLESELKKNSITRDDISSVFNVFDSNIILNRGWRGASNKEGQVRSTLLYLTAIKLHYNLDEVDSSELRKALLSSGVPMDNHSTNIKNFATLIVHKRGPIGSTANSYRITPLGFQKGITLIKDIIDNTSNFDIKFKSNIKTEKAEKISVDIETLNQHIQIFANQNKIDEEKLKTLFDFQENGVRISQNLKDNIRKILQIKTLMLIGILIKRVYDVKSFSGGKLLKDSRITADRLDLLDTNKYYKSYFSINKPKSVMQLTYAGEKKAIEMLKEYLEKGNCSI